MGNNKTSVKKMSKRHETIINERGKRLIYIRTITNFSSVSKTCKLKHVIFASDFQRLEK